jgi:hypothetical protein
MFSPIMKNLNYGKASLMARQKSSAAKPPFALLRMRGLRPPTRCNDALRETQSVWQRPYMARA